MVDITGNCNSCHKLDPNGNPSADAPGFFGTEGRAGFDFEPQFFKAPHLRNAYQKVGMFGRVPTPTLPPGSGVRLGVDRDEDGYLDGDERDAGSDPADPTSIP